MFGKIIAFNHLARVVERVLGRLIISSGSQMAGPLALNDNIDCLPSPSGPSGWAMQMAGALPRKHEPPTHLLLPPNRCCQRQGLLTQTPFLIESAGYFRTASSCSVRLIQAIVRISDELGMRRRVAG